MSGVLTREVNGFIDYLLGCPQYRRITLIGGGGKTTLMYLLANVFRQHRRAVVTTTTTKLCRAERLGIRVVEVSSLEECRKVIQEDDISGPILTLVSQEQAAQEKWTGLPAEWVDELAAEYKNVMFLIEGDGSAGKSLKGHREYEPVIPGTSDLILLVAGLDVIEKPLNDTYVQRAELVCQISGRAMHTLVDGELLSELLFHPQGYLRCCPVTAVALPVLSKVDLLPVDYDIKELVKQLLQKSQGDCPGVVVGNLLRGCLDFWR